jgi:hypothetical protein
MTFVFLLSINSYALGCIVDIDVSDDEKNLIWTLEEHPLIEEELQSLSFYCENFEEAYNYSNPPISKSFIVPIPDDAKAEDLKRYDYDTSLGCMVEVVIPRRKQLNKLAWKEVHSSPYHCDKKSPFDGTKFRYRIRNSTWQQDR